MHVHNSLVRMHYELCIRHVLKRSFILRKTELRIRKRGALARLLRQVLEQYFSVLLLAQANRLNLHVVEGCYLDQFEDYFPKFLKPEYQLAPAIF